MLPISINCGAKFNNLANIFYTILIALARHLIQKFMTSIATHIFKYLLIGLIDIRITWKMSVFKIENSSDLLTQINAFGTPKEVKIKHNLNNDLSMTKL